MAGARRFGRRRTDSVYAGQAVDLDQAALTLELLRALGWLVRHDVPWPDRPDAQVDHLLVGPPGVFVLVAETDTVAVDPSSPHEWQDEADEVLSAATDVAASLPGVPVTPVVVFTRAEPFTAVAGSVFLCSLRNVVEVLSHAPVRLDDATLSAVRREIGDGLQSPALVPPAAWAGVTARQDDADDAADPEPEAEEPGSWTNKDLYAELGSLDDDENPDAAPEPVDAPEPEPRGDEAAAADELARLADEQAEVERVDAERAEAERAEAERLEQERLAAEEAARVEAERVEQERLAAEEAARVEAERVEQERLAAEAAARVEAERVEAEAARLEEERLAAEEAARVEAERIEQERLAAEEAARAEAESAEQERLAEEQARVEAERAAQAAARDEAARVEAAGVETARLESERVEAERLYAERVAADRAEAARLGELDQPEEPDEPQVDEPQSHEPQVDETHVEDQVEVCAEASVPVVPSPIPEAPDSDEARRLAAVEAEAARAQKSVEAARERRARLQAPREVEPAAPVAEEPAPARERKSFKLQGKPLVAAIVVGVLLVGGVAFRGPLGDLTGNVKSLFTERAPARLGEQVNVSKTLYHPQLRIRAGQLWWLPQRNQVAIRVTVQNAGGNAWTLDTASLELVDRVGLSHAPRAGGQLPKGAPVLKASSTVAPGRTVSGFVLFDLPRKTGVTKLRLELGPQDAAEGEEDPVVWLQRAD